MEIKIMMTIQNVPKYAKNYKYIVARQVDGEFYFWGAWNDKDKANNISHELGDGIIIVNE